MMIMPVFAMHIPDGFLSVPMSIVGWLFFVPLFVYALQQTRKRLKGHQIPLMVILTAFVFAAQMLNFPVAGGTSGHLIGAVLVGIFLGPWAMIVVMTCVLGVQALIFQDGGVLALGCNVVNMGIIGGLVGYAVYTWSKKWLSDTFLSRSIRIGLSAWLSVIVAALATALQLAISGTSPLDVVVPAMLGVHMLIGIGEAIITIATVALAQWAYPSLFQTESQRLGMRWIVIGYIIALSLVLLSPWANPNPDGLERVAEDHGFLEFAQEPIYTLLPDYTVPFIEHDIFTTMLAGVIGVMVVSGLGFYMVWRRANLPEHTSSS